MSQRRAGQLKVEENTASPQARIYSPTYSGKLIKFPQKNQKDYKKRIISFEGEDT